MKKLVAVNKYLSVALVVAAFATAGSATAFAQALTHDGSLLPHYFDAAGELKWGSWGPQEATAVVHRQALRPTRPLVQNAGRSAHTRVQ